MNKLPVAKAIGYGEAAEQVRDLYNAYYQIAHKEAVEKLEVEYKEAVDMLKMISCLTSFRKGHPSFCQDAKAITRKYDAKYLTGEGNG